MDGSDGVLSDLGIRMGGDTGPLWSALSKAQSALGTGGVEKDGRNPHFRSTYATLAATVATALPVLSAHGIAVMQPPTTFGGALVVTTILAHSSGAWISASLGVKPTKNDPQALGSAITYGRRYSLLGLVGLAPDDDDGRLAAAPPRERARPVEPLSDEDSAKVDEFVSMIRDADSRGDVSRIVGDARSVLGEGRVFSQVREAAKAAYTKLPAE